MLSNMKLNTPCEFIIWNVLPAVRSELARIFVKKHGLTQKDTAILLGVTEPAVSQYLKSKRGANKLIDKSAVKKIELLADKMLKSKNSYKNVCSLCRFVKRHKITKMSAVK